jgi:hypothetical protein
MSAKLPKPPPRPPKPPPPPQPQPGLLHVLLALGHDVLGPLAADMVSRASPSGFNEPCLLCLPSGPDWVHEIKHDGHR